MGHNALLIGVDAGGTSTRAVLTTAQGECIGYGSGGRGNPIAVGPDNAADGVLDAVALALAPSVGSLAQVDVITVAMAGQRAEDGVGGWLLSRLAVEGFTGRLTFESDLMATYSSGSAEPFGYAIVAGTGASAVRVAEGRIDATTDGLGWLLGDRGSGFWIGHRVARAAVRDLDGVGPTTPLTRGVLEQLGVVEDETRREGRPRTLEQLVEALYGMRPIELAALAPLAFAVDDPVASDPVAMGILRRAGERLADTLAAVLTAPGPLVVGGSVLSRPGTVRDAFVHRLGDAAAALELLPVADGAVGAGLLAMRAAGVSGSAEALGRLSETLARFR